MFPYHYTFADEGQDSNKSKKESKKTRRNRPRTPTTPNENHSGTFPAIVEQKPTEPRRSRRRKAQPLSPEIATTSCSPGNTDHESDVDECFGIGCVNRETNRTPRVKIHYKNNTRNKPTKPRRKKKKRTMKHVDDSSFMPSNNALYFHDRPASQVGSGFHNRESPARSIGPRRSAENVYGYGSLYGFRSPHEPSAARAFELPPLNDFRCRMIRRPNKLPPIVRDNQTDKKLEDSRQ